MRTLAIGRANLGWALDNTWIRMERGLVCLTAVVVDLASLRVKAHRPRVTREAICDKEVIEQVLVKHGTPKIINTDQGSQFTVDRCTCASLDAVCKVSMQARRSRGENAFVELLRRSAMCESVHLDAYESVSVACSGIADCLYWYYTRYSHSS